MDRTVTPTEARIDELEARLAQQDHAFLELSDEVYRQQRQIANLELQLRRMSERLNEIAIARPPTDPADEVPPHY